MTTTIETEILPALNPIQLLNQKIVEAKEEAATQFKKISYARSEHEKNPLVLPPDIGPAEASRLESEWQNQRAALFSAEKNFRPSVFIMNILDDAPSSKRLLKAALLYLREKHAAQQEAKARALPATAPKSGLPALIQNVLGNAPALEEPLPPARVHPIVTGPWGSEPLNIPAELAKVEREIKGFPELGATFTRLVDSINLIAGALHQGAAPAPQAVRCDKSFSPKWG